MRKLYFCNSKSVFDTMSIVDDFFRAISLQFRAVRFIIDNQMVWTLFVPLLLFIVLNIVGFYSIGELATLLSDHVLGLEVPLLAILLRILFFILIGLWGGYVVVIVMSPFLAYVSEKTEKILNLNDYPFNLCQFCKDVVRGIALAVRNSLMEIVVGIVLFLCTFIPIAGPFLSLGIGSILVFLVSAYFYGFSFMDYTNERRKFTVHQSVNWVKSRKGTACGHGCVFALMLYIPILGPFLSAIVAIVSTVAATIDVIERESVLETLT
ncbi:MAG: EI24 domain-containing protein [Bacteroidales bacterium]|nr:EI24 domain-containing protein [Bacteroidales bacterium]